MEDFDVGFAAFVDFASVATALLVALPLAGAFSAGVFSAIRGADFEGGTFSEDTASGAFAVFAGIAFFFTTTARVSDLPTVLEMAGGASAGILDVSVSCDPANC